LIQLKWFDPLCRHLRANDTSALPAKSWGLPDGVVFPGLDHAVIVEVRIIDSDGGSA
jgi:hypothetical protein